jgi:hypothetical protein
VRSSRESTSARRSGPLPSASPSRPLRSAERAWFEGRLGADFSQVRVHTGGQAAAMAGALGAKAFAAGDDIAFADGRYQPDTSSGRELLAHELAHVAQQRRGGGPAGQVESRARSAAQTAAQGGQVSPDALGGAEPGLHCDPDDDKKKPSDELPPWLKPMPNLQLQTLPPIEFLKMQSIYGAHGSRISLRDMDDMTREWRRGAEMLKLFGLDRGIKLGPIKLSRDDLLNLGLSLQLSDRFARENPNSMDILDQRWKNETGSTPIIKTFDIYKW